MGKPEDSEKAIFGKCCRGGFQQWEQYLDNKAKQAKRFVFPYKL